MIPEKYTHLPDHCKLLFEWGGPIKWGYSYRSWDDYLHHGFSDADIPILLQLLGDKALNNSEDNYQVWVPLYAWRILGQLKSIEAIDPLITFSAESAEDDWVGSEIPVALAMIGKPVMPLVARMLLDKAEEEHQKQIATDTLTEMARQYPELREEVIDYFRQYLQAPNPNYYGHNGLLVAHLLDIKAVELIDGIRALFENDYADITIAGDLEEVEIEFGLRKERSTPKPKYDLPGLEALSQLLGLDQSHSSATHDWDTNYAPPEPYVRATPKVGRNEPCPCGSGKKYKRCCMDK